MRLTEALLLEVPNGLSTEHAALTEPMAVGLHAVEKARLEPDDVPLVIGCGPVGLAVIAALRLRDARPIVAADFSPAPARARGGARRRRRRRSRGAGPLRELARSGACGDDPSQAPELPPWMPGPALRPAVIFECVGVPGVLDQIMASAPRGTRIVVVGVCMERDYIEPMFGINKELNLQFVLGYTPEEFAATLYAHRRGRDPGRAAGHRPGRRRGRGPGVRGPRRRPSGTRRSSSSRAATKSQARPHRRRSGRGVTPAVVHRAVCRIPRPMAESSPSVPRQEAGGSSPCA